MITAAITSTVWRKEGKTRPRGSSGKGGRSHETLADRTSESFSNQPLYEPRTKTGSFTDYSLTNNPLVRLYPPINKKLHHPG